MNAPLRKNLYYGIVSKIHLLFLLFSCALYAQTSTIESINKEFDTATKYAHSGNPEKAIPILDKIKKECESINYKQGITRVGHTLAIIYFNSSDYNKVISLSEDYLKTGEEIQDYEKLSHIHRLKGCAYSELGLLNKGDEEYDLALEYAQKIKAGNNKQHALGVIYGNRASHLIKSGAPQDAIFASINKSIAEAEKINESDNSYISKKYSLIAYSYIILANEYAKAGNVPTAGEYYLKALAIHETKPVPLVEKVVLLSELGYFYTDQKAYDKAVKYAESGIKLEKEASFPQLRRDLFETLSKAHLELHQTEASKKYLSLFTALNDSINNSEKKAVDTALRSTISKQKKQYLASSSKQTVIYILSFLALAVLGIVLFLRYKKQKQIQIQKIESVLEQLKARQNQPETIPLTATESSKTEEAEETEDDKEEVIALMSPEAEEKLLEKLHDFEQKQLYLERKVSLSYVAAQVETNTKYLSYIIKKHKGKDFNKYINDLRINYIVQKINDNPVYRQYKINVLAEETGFSSHSKFATVFKSTVGVSPSEFIKYYQDNERDKKEAS